MHFYGDDRPDPVVWVKDGAFAATLLSPQPGVTLTDTLTLTWQQSHADLAHLVLYSTDGGTTWSASVHPSAATAWRSAPSFCRQTGRFLSAP